LGGARCCWPLQSRCRPSPRLPTGFSIGNADRADAAAKPMPFEREGDSFPGAAFHPFSQDLASPPLGRGIHGDGDPALPQIDPLAGPAAQTLCFDDSGNDRMRALQCLAAAIYYEAASEPDAGQRAVAQIVLYRVAHGAYPKTLCGAVYQGSEKATGCQFSFACDG
jgi:hypothetical protein